MRAACLAPLGLQPHLRVQVELDLFDENEVRLEYFNGSTWCLLRSSRYRDRVDALRHADELDAVSQVEASAFSAARPDERAPPELGVRTSLAWLRSFVDGLRQLELTPEERRV